MPPSQQDQKMEALAWRTLDEYVKFHPKPRLTPRMRHRCKLWLRSHIPAHVSIDGIAPDYYYPLNDQEGRVMVENAERTINE